MSFCSCGFGNYGGLWKKSRCLTTPRSLELIGGYPDILTFHLGRWSEHFCFKDEGYTCTVQSYCGSIRPVISVYLPEIYLFPWKLNTAAENLPFQNERIVFQPSFFQRLREALGRGCTQQKFNHSMIGTYTSPMDLLGNKTDQLWAEPTHFKNII